MDPEPKPEKLSVPPYTNHSSFLMIDETRSMPKEDLQSFLDGAARFGGSVKILVEALKPLTRKLNTIVNRAINAKGGTASVPAAQHFRPMAKDALHLMATFESAETSMNIQKRSAEAAIERHDTHSALRETNELYGIFMDLYPTVDEFGGKLERMFLRAKPALKKEIEELDFLDEAAVWKEAVEQWLRSTSAPAWIFGQAEVTETGLTDVDATQGG